MQNKQQGKEVPQENPGSDRYSRDLSPLPASGLLVSLLANTVKMKAEAYTLYYDELVSYLMVSTVVVCWGYFVWMCGIEHSLNSDFTPFTLLQLFLRRLSLSPF
jgi:hypothetical protein